MSYLERASSPPATTKASGGTGGDSLLRVSDRLDPNAAWRLIRDRQRFHDVPTISAGDSTWNTPKSDCTRIVCMSDTHGHLSEIAVPQGDILVHGGDVTSTGETAAIQELTDYVREKAFPHTICIAGNHDLTLHESFYQKNWKRFHSTPLNSSDGRKALETLMEETAAATSDTAPKFVYLEDKSCNVPISIYGSPWTPEFYNWAFNVPRGQPSWDTWAKIPDDTDVLVTHGPPLGRGDLCTHVGRAGCYDLLYHVQQRVKPRLHIFGHIHEGYGASFDGTTLFVNASNLNFCYEHVHPCIVIDLPHDPSQSARIVKPQCRLTRSDFLEMIVDGNYEALVDALLRSGCDDEDIPSGNELLQTADACRTICEKLIISKERKIQVHRELRMALSALYSMSF